MNRVERVVETFNARFHDVARPIRVERARWNADALPVDPTGLHVPYGVTAPVGELEGKILEDLVVFYCPEVIVEQSQHLDERFFVDYIVWWVAHLQLHVIHWEDEDAFHVEEQIDRTLWELSPDSMSIGNSVMVRALDHITGG